MEKSYKTFLICLGLGLALLIIEEMSLDAANIGMVTAMSVCAGLLQLLDQKAILTRILQLSLVAVFSYMMPGQSIGMLGAFILMMDKDSSTNKAA